MATGCLPCSPKASFKGPGAVVQQIHQCRVDVTLAEGKKSLLCPCSSSEIRSVSPVLTTNLLANDPGPIVRLSPSEVDICDIAAAKTVYSIKETFHKSKFYTNVTNNNAENVFNTPNPTYNRRLRRLLGGPMSEGSLKSLEPTVATHVDLVIQRIGEEITSRGAADVLKWWTFMSTDVIGQLTFGESFRMLEQGKVIVNPLKRRSVELT